MGRAIGSDRLVQSWQEWCRPPHRPRSAHPPTSERDRARGRGRACERRLDRREEDGEKLDGKRAEAADRSITSAFEVHPSSNPLALALPTCHLVTSEPLSPYSKRYRGGVVLAIALHQFSTERSDIWRALQG